MPAERWLPLGRDGREGQVRLEGERGCPWMRLDLLPGDASGGPTVTQRLRPSDARNLAAALLAVADSVDGIESAA